MVEQSAPRVLLAGHISLDIIPDLSKAEGGFEMFRPGQLIAIGGMGFATGGSVLNTGLALHKLGCPVRLLLHRGTDPYGTILEEMVRSAFYGGSAERPAMSEPILTVHTGEQTAFTLVVNPKGQDRLFLTCPGTNRRFSPDDISDETLAGIQLFHLGYPPLLEQTYRDEGVTLAAFLHRLQDKGIVTSLDMCMPDAFTLAQVDWTSFLANVLPYVDVFMPSADETFCMLRGNDTVAESWTAANVIDMAQSLVDMGAKIVALKLGEHGLYLRTGIVTQPEARGRPPWWQALGARQWNHRQLYTPCFEVQVAGTTGAGDSTIAGFLSGLLNRCGPEDCLTHAVAVGACSVEELDACSGVPSYAAVQRRISEGWNRRQTSFEMTEWRCTGGAVHSGPQDFA